MKKTSRFTGFTASVLLAAVAAVALSADARAADRKVLAENFTSKT